MVALFQDDPAFVGSTLASMTSGASLFEFLLTPFLGAFSDKVGSQARRSSTDHDRSFLCVHSAVS